jgi:hypothetical protein
MYATGGPGQLKPAQLEILVANILKRMIIGDLKDGPVWTVLPDVAFTCRIQAKVSTLSTPIRKCDDVLIAP